MRLVALHIVSDFRIWVGTITILWLTSCRSWRFH